jgi:hypothetical protein
MYHVKRTRVADNSATQAQLGFPSAAGQTGVSKNFATAAEAQREADAWGHTGGVRLPRPQRLGRLYKWFASRSALGTDTDGTAYQVTGTVKKYEEYEGTRYTVLPRCEVAA